MYQSYQRNSFSITMLSFVGALFIFLVLPSYSFSMEQPDIIFVQIPLSKEPENIQQLKPYSLRHYVDGSRIVLLSKRLNHLVVLTEDMAAACDPAVTFDGSAILFAGKKTPQDTWQIWRMDTNGDHKEQITTGLRDCRSPLSVGDIFHLDDEKPAEQILFVSSDHGWNFPNDSKEDQPVYSLYVCNLDGSNPSRISYNPGSDLYPDVLPNGKIVYSSWQWNQKENETNSLHGKFSLFSLCIDGTEIFPYCISKKGSLVMSRVAEKAVYFIQSNAGDWLGGGELLYVSQRRPFQSQPLILNNRLDTSAFYHSPCFYDDEKLLVSYRNSKESPHYSLVLLSTKNGSSLQTVFLDEDWHCIDAQIVAPHQKVKGRSTVVQADQNTGVFYCLNVYTSNQILQTQIPHGSIKKVRVIQSAPNHFQQEDLGTAPVEDDGSFYIRVPASVPLRFELLDEMGNTKASQSTWTWVMPGESRGCIGCHDDPALTPQNILPAAVVKPAIELPKTVKQEALLKK